jgi:hypothetical protein
MCDPRASGQGDRDFYPQRHRGSFDYGGVHYNSGIANLGKQVLHVMATFQYLVLSYV